jgi:glycosyltransferase involved in cell wall biosynthesis
MHNTEGKKKKIIYLITVSEFGGAQKYVYDLSSYLVSGGNYEVVVGASKFNGDMFGKLKRAHIPCRELKYLKREISPLWDIFALFEIISFLNKEKPDVVHLNSTKISILGSIAARIAGVPKIIYTAHGWVFNEALPPFKKAIYVFAEKMTARLKTTIINVSEYDMLQAKQNSIHPKDRMIVVHNGIDSEVNFPEKRFARHELNRIVDNPNFSAAELIIGTVAYFYKNKGLEYLLEAAHVLKQNGEIEKQKMAFLIIGEGLEENRLRELVKKYGLKNHVFMPGKVMDFSKYLKAFDIFALTSVKEACRSPLSKQVPRAWPL